jgi:hypothetical protein
LMVNLCSCHYEGALNVWAVCMPWTSSQSYCGIYSTTAIIQTNTRIGENISPQILLPSMQTDIIL